MIPNLDIAKKIKIHGEINVPGEFSISKNTSLSQIVEKAGGYSSNAYPIGGILLRRSVRDAEIMIKEKSYNEIIKFISSSKDLGSISSNPEGLSSFLSLMTSVKPSGRLVTEFDLDKISLDPKLDTMLQDGDEIFIPPYINQVYVFGEVMTPSARPYLEGGTAMDYIKLAGGLSRLADKSRIIVISPNGDAMTNGNPFSRILNSSNQLILPGTYIYVPLQIGRLEGLDLASSVAPLVSSLALSLASLNSISNN